MEIEFSFGKNDKDGCHTAYVEWSAAQGVTRRMAYETASTILESVVCWKGWPHLDDAVALPKRGWTHRMDTVEADGSTAERHLLTFIFESMLDQLQFVSWWDTRNVELHEDVEPVPAADYSLDDLPVLDELPEFEQWPRLSEVVDLAPQKRMQCRTPVLVSAWA